MLPHILSEGELSTILNLGVSGGTQFPTENSVNLVSTQAGLEQFVRTTFRV